MKKFVRKFSITAIALFTAGAAYAAAPTTSPTFSPKQTKAIEKIIRSYLVANPQVLVEVAQSLELQKRQKQQSQAMTAIGKNKQDLFANPDSPAIGPKKPTAYVVEFFDYQCGHCRAVAPAVTNIMKKDKTVRFVFKELPIFGGASKLAAQAALAANKHGKYKAVHDALFSATSALNKQSVLKYATKAGLNASKISKEMNKHDIEKQLRDNFQLAQKLGIMGTPAFVISNGAMTKFQFVPGAVDESRLQAMIQAVQK